MAVAAPQSVSSFYNQLAALNRDLVDTKTINAKLKAEIEILKKENAVCVERSNATISFFENRTKKLHASNSAQKTQIQKLNQTILHQSGTTLIEISEQELNATKAARNKLSKAITAFKTKCEQAANQTKSFKDPRAYALTQLLKKEKAQDSEIIDLRSKLDILERQKQKITKITQDFQEQLKAASKALVDEARHINTQKMELQRREHCFFIRKALLQKLKTDFTTQKTTSGNLNTNLQEIEETVIAIELQKSLLEVQSTKENIQKVLDKIIKALKDDECDKITDIISENRIIVWKLDAQRVCSYAENTASKVSSNPKFEILLKSIKSEFQIIEFRVKHIFEISMDIKYWANHYNPQEDLHVAPNDGACGLA